MARNLMTDDGWAFFEGFIRAAQHPNGRKASAHHIVLNDILRSARTCAPRLRPILMTTIATVLGALPLATATGAGSESRVAIGLLICSGLTFATALTLFATPMVYERVGRLRRRARQTQTLPAE